MLTFTRHSNADAVLIQLLRKLNFNIDPETVVAELEKHPDYPSLLAVSDVLNNFHIENSALRLQYDELLKVPVPFIAHTRINGGDFVLVYKIENGLLLYSNEKDSRQKTAVNEFKKIFSGVVLTAERAKTQEQFKSTETTLTRFRKPLIIAGLLSVFVMALAVYTGYFTNYTWQVLLLTVFKTAGLITSILLLIQSIDNSNYLIQKICQSGKKTNCNTILSSQAAKVPINARIMNLSWSEVGFFYFSGTWLILFFSNHSTVTLQTLTVLNLISLPYTFYSIYYQACIAKQWCVLCCIIQALLWLEFIPLVTTFGQHFSYPVITEWGAWFIAFVLPVIFWAILKPLLLKLQQLNPLKQQLRRFKYNQILFNQLLHEQPKYVQPDDNWSIVLGNVEANHCITMITNPYCPPCAKTHRLLEQLLDENPGVQARIIFTAENTQTDKKTAVSRHLLALSALHDEAMLKKAMHDWYEEKQKNYDSWAKIYPVQLIEKDFYQLEKQKEWCKIAEVTATPTLLLNGQRLPDLYQLHDLKYMLT